MKRLIVGMVLLCGAANAQSWDVLDAGGIARALTDRTVTYENTAIQHFYASGRTLYTFGEPSWGEWRVDAEHYCSLWPPAREWDCYTVLTDGEGGVNFVDAWDNDFFGVIAPE
jgi:hypothetical protein